MGREKCLPLLVTCNKVYVAKHLLFLAWLSLCLSNPCITFLSRLVKGPALKDAREPEDETPLLSLSTEGALGGSWPYGLVPTEHSFGKTSSKVTELRKRGRKQFSESAPVKNPTGGSGN